MLTSQGPGPRPALGPDARVLTCSHGDSNLIAMPELTEIEIHLEALRPRIVGQPLDAARIGSPVLTEPCAQLLKKDWPKTLEELEAQVGWVD